MSTFAYTFSLSSQPKLARRVLRGLRHTFADLVELITLAGSLLIAVVPANIRYGHSIPASNAAEQNPTASPHTVRAAQAEVKHSLTAVPDSRKLVEPI